MVLGMFVWFWAWVAQGQELPRLPCVFPKSNELVLLFLNSPDWTVSELDLEAGLYEDAATSIFRHRAGMDFTLGTWDDVYFNNLGQVAALRHVGPANMHRLVFYVVSELGPICPPGDQEPSVILAR